MIRYFLAENIEKCNKNIDTLLNIIFLIQLSNIQQDLLSISYGKILDLVTLDVTVNF